MAGIFLGSPTDFYRSSDLSMTYTDWLQRREDHDQLAFQITEPIKELITVSDQAFNAQINLLEKIEAAQAQAAYEVVVALRDLQEATEEGFRHVGSILEWGFTEVLVRLGRTNELLSDILATLKTPSATWAYEQFERARDRYRRRHYVEALEALDHAINGHAGYLGEITEYRFHYLRGIIKLGSAQNNSPEIVDASAAEQAFLLAARYSTHDFPTEAANALLCASHASNVQGHYEDAVTHAKKGLDLNETAGLHYELSRALLQLGQEDAAKDHLQWAIRFDKHLLLKAAGDPAFKVQFDFLGRTFTELVDEIREVAEVAASYVDAEKGVINNVHYSSPSTGNRYFLEYRDIETIAYTNDLQRSLQRGVCTGILDIRLHLERVPVLWNRLGNANEQFLADITRILEGYGESHRRRRAELLAERDVPEGVVGFIGWGVGLYILLVPSTLAPVYGRAWRNLAPLVTIPSAVAFGFVATFLAFVVIKAINSAAASRRKAIRDEVDRASSSIANELSSISTFRPYEPSNAIFGEIPQWALGLKAA
jgi:hypothetical protein